MGSIKNVIGLSLVIIVVVVFFFLRELQALEYNLNQAQLRNEIDQEYTSFLYKKDLLQNSSSGIVLNNQILVGGGDQERSELGDYTMASYEGTIFIRIKEEHCKACYDLFFEILNEFQEVSKMKLVIIASFPSDRSYSLFKDSKVPKIASVRIETDLNLSIEAFNTPYIFTLSPEGKTSNVYAINRSNIDQVNSILQSLDERNKNKP